MAAFWRHLFMVVTASVVWLQPVPALAQPEFVPAELTVSDAHRLAFALIERRQYRAALELLDTLQQEDSNITPLLFVGRSRAQRGLGNIQDAIHDGRTAYRLAETDSDKFFAAQAVAQAYSTAERRNRAQLWLRLAAQHAPDETTYALARRDFEYVRSRNPLTFNFSFDIQPTDNINNAPTDNTFAVGDFVFVSPTLVPISGTNFFASATANYRLPSTTNRTSTLRLTYSGRRVTLGSEASSINPDLSSGDLSSDRLQFGWDQRFRQEGRSGIIDTSFEGFIDWSAGEHVQNGANAEIGYRWPVADNQFIRVAAEYGTLSRLDQSIRSYDSLGVHATWAADYDRFGRVQIDAEYEDIKSSSFAVARDSWSLSTRYSFPEQILGTDLSLNFEYEETNFDQPLFGPAPRLDQSLTGTISAEVQAAEVFGFVPVVDLRRERVHSNVTTFDTEATEFGLSFRSSF